MPGAANPPTRPTVLVVEDEPIIRLVANDILEDAGFDVIEAATGVEAVAVFEDGHDIAVLFTDVHTPGEIDGLTLARVVAERWPSVRAAVTSGRARPAAGELPEGVIFVPKPYAAKELIDAIQSLLSRGSSA